MDEDEEIPNGRPDRAVSFLETMGKGISSFYPPPLPGGQAGRGYYRT